MLSDRDWAPIYASKTGSKDDYLINEFYVPALERSIRYDRVAGYFSSSALAVAARGIEALLENDGEMRLVVGTELYETDRPVLETLTNELSESLDDLDDERLDAQLKLLARLLREGRLHIKVADAREGSWEIFHPKMGIFHDADGQALSFEGSVNETVGGWKKNYERFKVHCSWIDGQDDYVEGDIDTFERLWNDEHPYVEVYDLPEAIERELIDWKDPDSDSELEEAIQIAGGTAPPTDRDKANIIADGALAPGGLGLAEDASTIEPWPHQRVVSDTLVNTYPQSFLLCDEVGLGKTIEAGLTLTRLGLTDELETGLLLVPASLTIQWQEELWEKFNLNAYRYDRGSNNQYAFIDAFDREHAIPAAADLELDAAQYDQSWVESPIWRFLHTHQQQATRDSGPTIVIMSWHTARLSDRWDQVAPETGQRTRTREEVPASCRGRSPANRDGVWDAVIVDEAHNARKGSNFYSLLEQLRAHTQTYYLLTATPMQLHAGELYDLMSLLDLPDEWDTQDAFVEFFETRQALAQALRNADDPTNDESPDEDWSAQATLEDGRYQDRLPGERSFSSTLHESIGAELDVAEEDQARAIVKQRLLEACNLARAYGRHYDGYLDTFEEALEDHQVGAADATEAEKLKYLFYPDAVAEEEWLMFSRNDRLNALDELTEAGWQVVQTMLKSSTPVDALIHRNTRDTLRKYERVGLLDETVPTRNPEQHQIELTDETRAVYDRIDEYTRTFYKLAQQSTETETRAIGFVMTTYRQRLTSSIYAISQSLQTRLEKLRAHRTVLRGKKRAQEREYGQSQQVILETLGEYDLDDIDALDELEGDLEDADLAEVIPSVTDEGLELLEQEIDELESFVNDLTRIKQDPKIDQLKIDLDELDKAGHNRIIVFTQYADTMDFIRESLISIHGETVATYSGRGGEIYDRDSESWTSVGKEHVKREFAADGGQVDILVCTDSASEGLNLQECGALINYDLPWNPMRVEQRIGRIDRIGQQHEEVTIINYSYKDTVETDIYDRLDARIGLFENVVGEMQPILSGVNEQIRSATLEADDDDRDAAVERADQTFSEQMDDHERGDRVDVGESLETVDPVVEADVKQEAKLPAWQSYCHPDLDGVGETTPAYPVPYEPTSLQAFLVNSEPLAEAGVTFTPFTELEINATDLGATFEYSERTFRLEHPSLAIPTIGDDGSLAHKIAPEEDAIAVTFAADCADEYPSIQYLAPGNPVLDRLLELEQSKTDQPARFTQYTILRDSPSDRPLVCGWGRNKDIHRLTADGTNEVAVTVDVLENWSQVFRENRNIN